MKIHNKPLSWYVDRLRNDDFFSMGHYGDGEWLAILREREGRMNAEHTVYTKELCDDLEESLRFRSDSFLFSTPEILKSPEDSGIGEKKIDNYLKKKEITDIEFYEKDMWDTEVREQRFAPFIKELRKKNVVIISNVALRGLTFLNYDKFVEISYPNCHTEIDRAVEECLEYGKSGVYLVAMGLPAAVLVQRLHGKIPNSFILDLGSVWDAFVGIGAQRGWRYVMYEDKDVYEKWKQDSLKDI